MKKLGHDFGSMPFGIRQVAERLLRRNACTCDPRYVEFASDVACPTHGLDVALKSLRTRGPAA